jgi:hypothetical protein
MEPQRSQRKRRRGKKIGIMGKAGDIFFLTIQFSQYSIIPKFQY